MARGYNANGDLITKTADGVDLNKLWGDYQALLASYNTRRDTIVNLLSYKVAIPSEELFEGGTTFDFEEATQYGEPVGVRPEVSGSLLGYTFKWYDLAARFTWQFLADAPASQVDMIANGAAEAHNRLMFNYVLKTLYNNTRRTNKEGITVYPFYSGIPGDLPPAYGATTFPDSHNHFVTSGSATLDPGDLEQLQGLLTEHGYTNDNGYTLVCMINAAQENAVRQFRSIANGGQGNYDFVPALGSASFLLPNDLRVDQQGATRPPATYKGMRVVGSYGSLTIVVNEFNPIGYLVAFATGGAENINNPVAIREHANASLRGLKLVKGRTPDYPLIDSFYNVGFGSGVRYRGSAAIMQLTASPTYTVPPAYVW